MSDIAELTIEVHKHTHTIYIASAGEVGCPSAVEKVVSAREVAVVAKTRITAVAIVSDNSRTRT